MNFPMRRSALALVAVLTFASAVPSAAAPVDEEGLWYFDMFNVQNVHDSGITGEGVTIALIDSPVNLEIPTLADADVRVQDAVCIREDGTRPSGVSGDYDVASHGTGALTYLVGSGAGFPGQTGVKGLAPGATVLTYYAQLEDDHDAGGQCPGTPSVTFATGYTQTAFIGTSDEIGLSMHAAMDAGADIISISMGAAGGTLMMDAIARAVREGVIVVAALPNEGSGLAGSAPARFNGVVAVNLISAEGETPVTVHSPETDIVAPGVPLLVQGDAEDWKNQRISGGTSFSTPIVAGNLALAMQKYPDATPNQLLQSLIRNTGEVAHDLMWDPTYGYGVVITDVLLDADPTVYPDVNPLVSDHAGINPDVEWIWPGSIPNEQELSLDERPWPIYTPEPTPPSESPTTDADSDSDPASTAAAGSSGQQDDNTLGWLIPSIIIGVVVLITIVAVIVVVAVRANQPTGGPHGTK